MTIRILLIDDEFGRPDPGPARAVASMLGARRVVECISQRELFLDAASSSVDDPGRGRGALDNVAIEVHVCPGQLISGARKENSRALVQGALQSGWPFADGQRWSLVLVDLTFPSNPTRADDADFFRTVFADLARYCPGVRGSVFSSADQQANERQLAQSIGGEFVVFIPKTRHAAATRKALRDALHAHGLYPDLANRLVGRSLSWLETLRATRNRVTRPRTTIVGPPGSGKEGIARLLHDESDRNGHYVSYALHEGVSDGQMIEVFGADKAIAGTPPRKSLFEEANNGTLFLDEVQNCASQLPAWP